jgi:hypothetical protein
VVIARLRHNRAWQVTGDPDYSSCIDDDVISR